MTLSQSNTEHLRGLTDQLGHAAVARALGVPRSALVAVLSGSARHCTAATVSHAYVTRAAVLRELEGSR